MIDNIIGRKGAWINQFAQPSPDQFLERARQVDYIVIKYGLPQYELVCRQLGIAWLAEVMAERGVGDQTAPNYASEFGKRLADQANQTGCIGAVINLEEADGGWHRDSGSRTVELINTFRRLCPNKPLYASLDTRAGRPNYEYQKVCAQLCDGVMPMVYPKAFGQSAAEAFNASINQTFVSKWAGKPIIPTIQTYDGIGPVVVNGSVAAATDHCVNGVNAYTLGHATESEWRAFVEAPAQFAGHPAYTPPEVLDPRVALLVARVRFLEAMCQLAVSGTADEVLAFATFWKQASGS